jgi:hypothetical protein
LRGQGNLSFDDRFANCSDNFAVARDIEIRVAEDVVDGNLDQQVVDVVAAQVGVPVGRDDLENSIVQLENGNVEGAAAEVVNRDDAVLLFV